MSGPDETEAIKLANLEFYRALESLDVDRMDAVWVRDASVKCVHPGWPLLQGWEAVRESWERIFDNTSAMQFSITAADITHAGDWAWVTCTENLISVVDGRAIQGKVQATNIFRKDGNHWLLVLHHGSPVA